MSDEALTLGIPREIKPGERRVGLTPRGARVLREAGVPVLVEKGAGGRSGYSDREFQKAGAEIVGRVRDLYLKSDLIQKVKEPFSPEWKFLKEGLLLFCFLHLASPENQRLVKVLLDRKIIGIGFDTVEKSGRTLLLEPMSEIAGTLAGYYSGFFREAVRIEKGKVIYPPRFLEKLEWLAGYFPEVPEGLLPGRVAIYGGGTVGRKAAAIILKMGGRVDLVEKREDRREVLRKEFEVSGSSFQTWSLNDNLEEILKKADVWIGCVHVAGERAPQVLSQEDLERVSRGKPKLILDIAADQGGNFPETRGTTYEDPLFLDSFGNLRFGVTNVPSLCGRGASEALEEATLPYTLRLAQNWKKALQECPELQKGLQVFQGKRVRDTQ